MALIEAAGLPGPLRQRNLLIGGAITASITAMAVVSLVWTPYDPTVMNVASRLQGPSGAHLLGTDAFGRDILSELMVGAQNSIAVGVVAVAIGLGVGTIVGLLAAFPTLGRLGVVIEDLLMRGSDLIFAFPAVLSAIMITALLGPGAINSIIAIGIFTIPVFARLAQGAAKQVWAREFTLAAEAAGKGRLQISFQHVLPNIAGLLIVQATIQFALAILAEAGLSYLGLGTQPPAPSWGRMLLDAQTFLYVAPTLAIWPGLTIALSVLGLNLLGDGLRDYLDPRLREGRSP